MKNYTEYQFPQIIAVSSGKGGVGKTAISVNLARVLSWSEKRILLIDLDLHNRGSTTLVAEAPIIDNITVGTILDMVQDRRSARLKKAIAILNHHQKERCEL